MNAPRYLIVIADDFGIGPETSRGILDLALRGVVTGTVLMVNSPHAESAVRAWRAAGSPLEMGWHPCLTQDRPSAPVGRVTTLIGPDGFLWPLGQFLTRLLGGLIRPAEIRLELEAQLRRYGELVGGPPAVVNSHQHVSLFPPVGRILRQVLDGVRPRPYFRRVREPLSLIARIPGARVKRLLLTALGSIESRRQERGGYPGQTWLAGITDPPAVQDPAFFTRWLAAIPGRDVELACHPGHPDETLVGRDCQPDDGLLQRRVDELALLSRPEFLEVCRAAGFTVVGPTHWLLHRSREVRHAA